MSRYIDADLLLQALNKNKIPFNADINYLILNAPKADVQELRHGRNITGKNPVDEFICSECGFMFDDISEKVYDEDGDYYFHREYEFRFCPNCGAKMEE